MTAQRTATRPSTATGQPTGSLSFLPMLAITIGSMVGAGIFALPGNIAKNAAPGPALIGWLITGIGMFCLANVFRVLADRRPDLDAGVYAYAKVLFGPIFGLLSAWGYWISAWVANLAYFVMITSTLSAVIPAFGDGTTWPAIAAASVLLWIYHGLILLGIKPAALVNTIATIGKVVPLVLFIVLAIVGFKYDLFAFDFWGTGGDLGSTFDQVKNMMMITVWVFIGVEGASVYSQRAKNRRDVGRATAVGFIGVLALLLLVNLLSYGAMKRAELMELPDPSLRGVMESFIGPVGSTIVSVGILVSVLGALLAWILLSAEVILVAAADKTMPAFLGRLNGHGAPSGAFWVTSICMQVMLLCTAFLGSDPYLKIITLASALVLIPYLLSALYGVKLAWTGQTYAGTPTQRRRDLALGVVATVYAVWLLVAAGPVYVPLSAILYTPALIAHVIARREQGRRVFTRGEAIVAAVVVLVAIGCIVLLTQGALTI